MGLETQTESASEVSPEARELALRDDIKKYIAERVSPNDSDVTSFLRHRKYFEEICGDNHNMFYNALEMLRHKTNKKT